jgi:sortase A
VGSALALGYVAVARLLERTADAETNMTVEPPVTHASSSAPASPPAPAAEAGQRVGRRRLGGILVAVGVLVLAYVVAVVLWRDPATDLYARWRQHQLSSELDRAFASERAGFVSAREEFRLHVGSAASPPTVEDLLRAEQLAVARAANRAHRRLKLGKPLGRITVPRIGLKAVFVQGTRWGPDLSQGPGHYPQSSLPGVGRTVALAGHRTTFGAPFRHIDSLRAGDRIELSLSYATFDYRVFTHRIVDNEDWSIIRDRGFDTLVLSACHPLYSAAQRWVVFARLYRVDPVGDRPYGISKSGRLSTR